MVAHADALAAGDDDLAAAAEAALARHGVWVHPPRSGRRVTLTRREREVAVLAAAGLSSRDIAARLTISARTVDSHLARIYPKLGISSRADLSAVLGDR
jgi:DNA-binding CsgD family transcriptional regulator